VILTQHQNHQSSKGKTRFLRITVFKTVLESRDKNLIVGYSVQCDCGCRADSFCS